MSSFVRFRIDASLPRSTGDLIRACGDEAAHIRDTYLGDVADQTVGGRTANDRRGHAVDR